ncbi:MAG: formylmethanofuran dehydrogenase subunit E region [Methanolobus sp. T82-4]|jgi:formylmethanofuran dehydrogenase subunit E|nr:MAG: formylmethanofuran dehydrogenase subunit E region [Methanolobus sp. T82-4]
MDVQCIGIVKGSFKDPTDPEKMRKANSMIVVNEEFEDGLYKIEENKYLQVVFYFDKSDGYELIAERRKGGLRGVFASRAPGRPSPIGVTAVELIDRKGRELMVKGLDALDDTPVIDIKPYVPVFDDFCKT